jgi:hypothetical protein
MGYSFVEFMVLTNKKKNPPPSAARSGAGRPGNWFGFFQEFNGVVHPQQNTHRIILSSKIKLPLFTGLRVTLAYKLSKSSKIK